MRRRLDAVDPARCFHIRVSHDTVIKNNESPQTLGISSCRAKGAQRHCGRKMLPDIKIKAQQSILKNETTKRGAANGWKRQNLTWANFLMFI